MCFWGNCGGVVWVYFCGKNTMKKLRIEPMGVTLRPNAEAADPGECSVMTDLRERNHAVEVVGEWSTLCSATGDEKLMLIDRRSDGDFYLACKQGEISLKGVMCNGEFVEKATAITTFDAEIVALFSVGDFVVVDTDAGRRYLRYKEGTYKVLDFAGIAPQLMFKTVNETLLTESVPGITFDEPYTQWNVLAETDRLAVQSAVRSAVGALKSKAARNGAYIQPVAVRYGVRLWDDSYAWISAPVVVGCGVQMAERISAMLDSDLSACGESSITASAYNVGVMPVKSPDADWLPLIKAVDVLVSEEMNPFADGQVTCRCETSQSGGVERYLTCALLQKERLVAAASLINPDKWRVLTTITDAASLFADGGTRTIIRSGLFTTAVSREEMRAVASTINHEAIAVAGVCVGGRLYSGGIRKKMRHAWHSVQSWGGDVTEQACEVIVTARIHTEEGEAVKCDLESYAYTPTSLNALVAYPDARAKELSIKVLSNDVITEWNGTLAGVDEQGYAYFLNTDFAENAFADAYSFYMLTEQNTEESALSELSVSRVGNPFVTAQRRTVGQGSIVALTAVAKSLYSTVFGRYPVYAFTSEGIYAVSYKEIGDYSDAQLVSRVRLGDTGAMAASPDKVFFVSERDELCALAGKDVAVLEKTQGVTQLAWVASENELLLRYTDNSVEVFMPCGRRYGRTTGLCRVYSDFYDAVASDLSGNWVNLNKENSGTLPIIVETYPIAIKDDESIAPMMMMVNATGDFDEVKVELRGSNGVTYDWRTLAEISLSGTCCHPVMQRIYAKPCRLVMLCVKGAAKSGAILRNVMLTYK